MNFSKFMGTSPTDMAFLSNQGGAILGVRPNMTVFLNDLVNIPDQCISISISLFSKSPFPHQIIALYCPPNYSLHEDIFKLFTKYTILIGHLNSPHVHLGCNHTSPIGSK